MVWKKSIKEKKTPLKIDRIDKQNRPIKRFNCHFKWRPKSIDWISLFHHQTKPIIANQFYQLIRLFFIQFRSEILLRFTALTGCLRNGKLSSLFHLFFFLDCQKITEKLSNYKFFSNIPWNVLLRGLRPGSLLFHSIFGQFQSFCCLIFGLCFVNESVFVYYVSHFSQLKNGTKWL